MPQEALTNLLFIGQETVDVNNCIQTGIYQINTNVNNAPAYWCLILVLNNPIMGSIIQLAVKIDNPSQIFVRTRESSSAGFTGWVKIATSAV